MSAARDRSHAPEGEGLTCAAADVLAVRASVAPLDASEDLLLTEHVLHCQRCRVSAIEHAEFAASLRSLDASIGDPSRRFAERLRARISIERALAPGGAAPGGVAPGRGESNVKPTGEPSGARADAAQPLTRGARRVSPLPRTLIVKGTPWFASRPAALWLAAGLLVSITLNFLWVSRVLFGPGAAPSSVLAAAAETPPLTARALDAAGRVESLRAQQSEDGLIAGDPAATAWWLIAESRLAARLGGPGAPVKPLAFENAERAQTGLLAVRYESTRERAVAVLALAESSAAFGSGNSDAIAAFAGSPTVRDAQAAARDQLRFLSPSPKEGAGRELGLTEAARRAARQNGVADSGESNGARTVKLTMAGLASGDGDRVLSFLYPDIARALGNGAHADLTEFRGSPRAEALCAAAAASAQE